MHNPESVQENEIYKRLWDFEIQIDHLMSARRPDLEIIKKNRTCRKVYFAIPADRRVKLKESKMKDKHFEFAWDLKFLYINLKEINRKNKHSDVSYAIKSIPHGPDLSVPESDGNMEYSSDSKHRDMMVVAREDAYSW